MNVNAVWMSIQSIMIFLSVALKATANRWAILILGVFAVVVIVVATYVGGIDVRYAIQVSVELVLIALILWYAWKWPKQEV